ncbi:hypothetical protein TSAR_005096 [Trichomalopsis sarcophagae]|uniref:Uncharacterized protein n=1 Tax=Trichomalopsis sarcophagae TaxID=543379 RepID=A0A232FLP0_9HYME|nr:hypothetical protein TSAR_005096 [Trichomalopsis sarcophagae]
MGGMPAIMQAASSDIVRHEWRVGMPWNLSSNPYSGIHLHAHGKNHGSKEPIRPPPSNGKDVSDDIRKPDISLNKSFEPNFAGLKQNEPNNCSIKFLIDISKMSRK